MSAIHRQVRVKIYGNEWKYKVIEVKIYGLFTKALQSGKNCKIESLRSFNEKYSVFIDRSLENESNRGKYTVSLANGRDRVFYD